MCMQCVYSPCICILTDLENKIEKLRILQETPIKSKESEFETLGEERQQDSTPPKSPEKYPPTSPPHSPKNPHSLNLGCTQNPPKTPSIIPDHSLTSLRFAKGFPPVQVDSKLDHQHAGDLGGVSQGWDGDLTHPPPKKSLPHPIPAPHKSQNEETMEERGVLDPEMKLGGLHLQKPANLAKGDTPVCSNTPQKPETPLEILGGGVKGGGRLMKSKWRVTASTILAPLLDRKEGVEVVLWINMGKHLPLPREQHQLRTLLRKRGLWIIMERIISPLPRGQP